MLSEVITIETVCVKCGLKFRQIWRPEYEAYTSFKKCESCRMADIADGDKVENIVFAIESMLFSHELTIKEYKKVLKHLTDRLDGHIDKCVVVLNKDFKTR